MSMDKEENNSLSERSLSQERFLHELRSTSYSWTQSPSVADLNYSTDHGHHQRQHELMKSRICETSVDNNGGMIDYMLDNPQLSSGAAFCTTNIDTSLDKWSFADVMQVPDFGTKLALNQTKLLEEETGIDPVFFLKFPVLNDKIVEEKPLMIPQTCGEKKQKGTIDEEEARVFHDMSSMQFKYLGDNQDLQNKDVTVVTEAKNKRKRLRTIKTSEEVESQRMNHIAVERNRRKQMNEHLCVLRSLMPGSYVQRGRDQASIIGGAIEFVRELEQLLQCLESQKRRRLHDESSRQIGGDPSLATQQHPQPPLLPLPNDQMNLVEFKTGRLHEETAENKSCLADVEVKVLGFDAMIKILSRRRPSQLVKTIAALEDLQLNIRHTNITTMEQTVLYSFNVKVASDSRFTAEDIASSVQQIFGFIHANSLI